MTLLQIDRLKDSAVKNVKTASIIGRNKIKFAMQRNKDMMENKSQVPMKTCLKCNKDFMAYRVSQDFCSTKCRNDFHHKFRKTSHEESQTYFKMWQTNNKKVIELENEKETLRIYLDGAYEKIRNLEALLKGNQNG